MATIALSTSPTQIDTGSSYSVLVANTGSSPVELSRGGRLRPGQTQTVYPEGAALTAVSLSGAGQVTTTTVAGKPLPNPSDPSTLATDPAFTGAYAGLNPAVSSYTYNTDGTVATETVAGVTTTYTYNTDGTVATSARAGVTRTYAYNGDGTLASVA